MQLSFPHTIDTHVHHRQTLYIQWKEELPFRHCGRKLPHFIYCVAKNVPIYFKPENTVAFREDL